MKTFITFTLYRLKIFAIYVIIIPKSMEFVKTVRTENNKMQNLNLPKSIKMVITDFDGVVTDNCVYINEDFTMSRKLNFKDVMGFSLLRKAVTKLR